MLMKKYKCGLLALKQWNIPYIDSFLKLVNKELDEEFMVFTDRSFYRPEGVELHSCKIDGAEKYTHGDSCTVPLLYLTIAPVLSKPQRIYLGLLICSYRVGKSPVCRLDELIKCAEELKGMRGRRQALQALQYVREGCRSPMEAILYMFLRLPNFMGGCNFKSVVFNTRIVTQNGNKYRFADLLIPDINLDIEFDSYEYHNNHETFAEDSIRAMELEEQGYQVISVKSEQLLQLRHYRTLVQNIARRLGKRIRIRARKFFEGFLGLRKLLKSIRHSVKIRSSKISLNDVPAFAGVKKMYQLYELALAKLRAYPKVALTLNST